MPVGWRYIVRRILFAVPILIGVTFFSYVMAVSSGNHFWIVLSSPQTGFSQINLTPQQIQQLQQYFHVNQPVWDGYFLWLSNLFQGNLGITVTGQSVLSTVAPWILPTVLLQVPAILTSLAIGLFIGVWSAARYNSRIDRILASSLAGILAIPSFWLATFAILAFAVYLRIFPAIGFVSLGPPYIGGSVYVDMAVHYVLPFLVLVVVSTPIYARLARAKAIDVMSEDWVSSLRLASISRSRILYRHVLKNSLGPVLAAFSVNLALFLAASPGIEFAFNWPGLGLGFARAAINYDQPLMMAIILLMALIAVAVTVVMDIVSAAIDPRITI